MRFRRTRVSQTLRIGPFRFRLSFGRGGAWGSASVPDGIGPQRRRRRSR